MAKYGAVSHLGHLPRAVIKGSVTRHQVYGEGA
jgi:hypothetical protein